jgi:hypothetical protein
VTAMARCTWTTATSLYSRSMRRVAVATPSLTTLLPTLVTPGADSGEIMLPVDGGFGWLIGSVGLGNGGCALAAGGTHITGVI